MHADTSTEEVFIVWPGAAHAPIGVKLNPQVLDVIQIGRHGRTTAENLFLTYNRRRPLLWAWPNDNSKLLLFVQSSFFQNYRRYKIREKIPQRS